MQLFYIHWNEAEANERVRALRRARHMVRVHWSTETPPALKENLPVAAARKQFPRAVLCPGGGGAKALKRLRPIRLTTSKP